MESKQGKLCIWSVLAGKHIHYFCVGLFHPSFGLVKYPYTKITFLVCDLPRLIKHSLGLVINNHVMSILSFQILQFMKFSLHELFNYCKLQVISINVDWLCTFLYISIVKCIFTECSFSLIGLDSKNSEHFMQWIISWS